MRIETTHKGYNISGEIIADDWEGDPSIPGGVRHFPPYIDDMAIEANGIDIYEEASERFRAECAEILLAGYLGRG